MAETITFGVLLTILIQGIMKKVLRMLGLKLIRMIIDEVAELVKNKLDEKEQERQEEIKRLKWMMTEHD